MKRKPAVLLLDTNVWLDNYLGYRPYAKEARALISQSLIANITLSYAATSIKDVFYCVKNNLKNAAREQAGYLSEREALACGETAWACVRSMTTVGVAATVGEPQIGIANLYEKINRDFEDNIILAAMECSNADFLVTNDETLLKKSKFPTLSSSDMLAVLENSM